MTESCAAAVVEFGAAAVVELGAAAFARGPVELAPRWVPPGGARAARDLRDRQTRYIVT